MAHSPIEQPSKFFLFLRISPAIFGVYLVATIALGLFVEGGSGFALQNQVVDRFTHMPRACLGGTPESDFQRRQCDDYWARLGSDAALAFSPWGVVGVFCLLASDQLNAVYRRARKKIEKGEALCKGTVTHPPELPQDLFAYVHRFRVVSLQLPNQSQMKVYVPRTAPRPRAGEMLAVFEGGVTFGAQRYIGQFYAPHVAIVRGGIIN